MGKEMGEAGGPGKQDVESKRCRHQEHECWQGVVQIKAGGPGLEWTEGVAGALRWGGQGLQVVTRYLFITTHWAGQSLSFI